MPRNIQIDGKDYYAEKVRIGTYQERRWVIWKHFKLRQREYPYTKEYGHLMCLFGDRLHGVSTRREPGKLVVKWSRRVKYSKSQYELVTMVIEDEEDRITLTS